MPDLKFEALYEQVVEDATSESPELSFRRFISKRAKGAAKIQHSAEKKGGASILTAMHFAAKEKPYAESKTHASKKGRDEFYKSKAQEVYKKLEDLDKLSQEEFQKLMGELEVWGEVYLQSTKPISIKAE